MASKKVQSRSAPRSSQSTSKRVAPQPPTISARWLVRSLFFSAIAALFCAWFALCLLFWQGSWQLLYHPKPKVERTPASVGIAYEPVAFAATETGQLRLQGWWIPAAAHAPLARLTVLYLHGADGNLGDCIDALARLHTAGVNVFAFDYRGYGQSQFVRPSETNWRQDAAWALDYLTHTRHLDAHSIVLEGDGLGADLALELAAANPHLAGVVLDSPVSYPMSVIFDDARAQLVPAHLLVHDRYDMDAAAAALRLPSLWFVPAAPEAGQSVSAAYGKVSASKEMVKVPSVQERGSAVPDALRQWLARLPD